jgi:hypothetical protein
MRDKSNGRLSSISLSAASTQLARATKRSRRSEIWYPSFRIGEIRTPDHISTLRLDKSLYAGSFHPGIGGTNMAYVLAQLNRWFFTNEIFYYIVIVP